MTIPIQSGIFTVSRLNTTVRQLLEMEMGKIWLSAEISNFSQPASGHWYFTLKDEKSQVKAAMFRGQNIRAGFRPQNGQQVLVHATITLYEPRGDYQLLINSMQPAGDGLLQQQFEVLKQKLSAEGLFEAKYKQPLPQPAICVGVITSKTGAALHDILNVLSRRDPSLPIIIYPTSVQGNDAPMQIVDAIEIANKRNECDVLIVGRGGGSLEDLWSFNDERVARAIFASRIPIVSAVGHETDITIADFVADLRAPTPSAAAELVSRNHLEMLRQLQSQQQRLEMAMDYYFARKQQKFNLFQHRLQQQHPQLRLSRQQHILTALEQRLNQRISRYFSDKENKLQLRLNQLNQYNPQGKLRLFDRNLQQYTFRLSQVMNQQIAQLRERFAVNCSHLEGVSPLAILARGFSISETENGEVLKKIKQVKSGQILSTRVQDGLIESTVTQVKKIVPRKIMKIKK